jgi:hypothetical protein
MEYTIIFYGYKYYNETTIGYEAHKKFKDNK